MDLRKALLDAIDHDREEIVGLCSNLVKTPSENPPGDTQAICEFIQTFLKKQGLSCEIYEPLKNAPNIVAQLKGGKPGRRLVYNGHMDTFPVGEVSRWTREPFSGHVEDGKIYGRGVSDMKGGVTASIMAFTYLARHREQWGGEVVLTLVSDEETGGRWGSCWLLENVPLVIGDAFLNGEPSSTELINFAEKGRLWLAVEAAGRGAHGAYTHMGINAIHRMIHFLKDIETLEGIDLAIPTDVARVLEEGRDILEKVRGKGATDALMKVTVNLGTITGGTKLNLVAESCRAEVDIRLPQGISCTAMFQQVDRIVAQHPGISYTVVQQIEPNYTSPDHEICVRLRKNAELIKGSPVRFNSGIGGSDAKHFRKYGVPCVIIGPRSHNMGGPDEFITAEDLIVSTKAHTLTSLDYLQGSPIE